MSDRSVVPQGDMWTFLLCTIRYSMGRRSAMPSKCADLYEKYGHVLMDHQKKQISNEIWEEVERCEAVDGFLGMETDHAQWINLSTKIAREL